MLYEVNLWLGAGIETRRVIVEARNEEEALVQASLECGITIDADEADDDIRSSDCYVYLDRTEVSDDCVYLLIENASIAEL